MQKFEILLETTRFMKASFLQMCTDVFYRCVLTVTTVYIVYQYLGLKTTDLTAPAETACFASDSGIDASS